jgi:hypothetical protein
MKLERLAHRETLFERRKRHAAKVTPYAQHPIEVDINDHVTQIKDIEHLSLLIFRGKLTVAGKSEVE